MNPEQKAQYLAQIDADITRREISIADLEVARNRADSKMQSRHDTQKEELNTQVNITRDLLDKEKKLREEVESSDYRYCVESGAFLDLLINGEPKQFLFMTNSEHLADVNIITAESPIGKALVEKIPGEAALYSVGEKKFRVEIKSIL